MKQEINFTLTVDEANLIFKSLGRMPFEQVYQLIAKMNQQAGEQFGGNASLNSISESQEK